MRTSIAVLALVAAGCSSTAPETPSPGSSSSRTVRFSTNPSTLLVTNAAGIRLLVKATPSLSPPIPQPLGGMLLLGSVEPSASACIEIPDTVFIFGTNVTTGVTDTIVWTSLQGLQLSAMDSFPLAEFAHTQWFTPSTAVGWAFAILSSSSVTTPPEVTAVQAARCAP